MEQATDDPAVPDVVGFDASDACDIITAAGLEPCGPRRTPPPATGTITEQAPPPGTAASPGAAVELRTGTGNHAGTPARPSAGSATEPQ